MKKCIYYFTAAIFLALSCVLTSCESKNDNLIVGTWYDGDYYYTFEDDGYFQMWWENYEYPFEKIVYDEGTWKIKGDKLTLRIIYDDVEEIEYTIVSLTEKTMELKFQGDYYDETYTLLLRRK